MYGTLETVKCTSPPDKGTSSAERNSPMSIIFGPDAVYALHRTLIAGTAALKRWQNLPGPETDAPPHITPQRPIWAYAKRTPATRPWKRDMSLYGSRKGSDLSAVDGAPDGFPADVYPGAALRDMREHAAAWTDAHETGRNTTATDPRGWYDPQPRMVSAIRPMSGVRGKRRGDSGDWNDSGTVWTLPAGVTLLADPTPGRTLSGEGFGAKVAQERTRKGTPRFVSAIPADLAAYGGHLPTPWVAPPSRRRLTLTLANAWKEAGQPERFDMRDTRTRKVVTDPLSRGGLLVTTVPPAVLMLLGAIVPMDEERARWGPVPPFALDYGTAIVWSAPTRRYPIGRPLGEALRWGPAERRAAVLAPMSATVVAEAVAMVRAGLIG